MALRIVTHINTLNLLLLNLFAYFSAVIQMNNSLGMLRVILFVSLIIIIHWLCWFSALDTVSYRASAEAFIYFIICCMCGVCIYIYLNVIFICLAWTFCDCWSFDPIYVLLYFQSYQNNWSFCFCSLNIECGAYKMIAHLQLSIE